MLFQTRHFGLIEYGWEAVFHFPAGLPGFEDEHEFVALEQAHVRPIVFLQSLRRPDLCFITLPVQTIEPGYRLSLSAEELRLLELPAERQPELGREVLCLAIVAVAEGQPPTANLLAPVVINLANRRAVQAIMSDSGYSHRHPLPVPAGEESVCSSCGEGPGRRS
ncbi:MAG: flagellar assembly protein FliW [Bryobacteraceae bacterium]